MSYDEGAIIGCATVPTVRLSFDGVRASYVDATYALDAFAVRPVRSRPTRLTTATSPGKRSTASTRR